MARRTRLVLGFIVSIMLVWYGARTSRAEGPIVHLEPFVTAFSSPIGIDFYEPIAGEGRLILSVNYPTGRPYNLALVNDAGVHEQYSNLVGEIDELKLATVRSGPCTGGFGVGTAFVGTGMPGNVAIARIDPGGTVISPWVTLPTDEAAIRGSLYQDRGCAFGGDLIVVTGNPQVSPVDAPPNLSGSVWRISSAGIATLVVRLGKHLEGVTTLPDDVEKYGPLAGRIVVGDEDRVFGPAGEQFNGPFGKVFGIKSANDIITVGAADPKFASFPNYPTSAPLSPEDLDVIGQARPQIPGDGDLFAVDFGGNQILRAPALDFIDKCGDILVAQELPDSLVPSGLSTLRWNGEGFDVMPLVNAGSAVVGHYEHVAFKGGADCTKPNLTIKKIAAKNIIAPGETASFTVTVTNLGPGTATGVVAKDALPAGLTWTHNRPGICAIVGDQLECAIGTLVEGASFAVTLSASTAAATFAGLSFEETTWGYCHTIWNRATVSGANEDPDKLADNSSTASIKVCPAPKPNLVVYKLADEPKIASGERATFTITVTNQGPGSAIGVAMKDVLPVGLTWTHDRPGICAIGGGQLNCTIGTLAQGASFAVKLSALTASATFGGAAFESTTSSGPCRAITNTATVWGANEDPRRLDDNSAAASILVCLPPRHGCTPGFWKNHATNPPWGSYTPSQKVGTVFTIPSGIPSHLAFRHETLLEALEGSGGAELDGKTAILLRAATAALLNADNGNPPYPITEAQVIARTNATLASLNTTTITSLAATFDEWNNQCDSGIGRRGKADLGVYRPSTGDWFIRRSSDGGPSMLGIGTSPQGRPVPADYDGDGDTDAAVCSEITGEWLVRRSSDGVSTAVNWGAPTLQDVPVPADYDGDGISDIAVYRGTTAEWFILRSSTGISQHLSWGSPPFADVPVPADYDGDGIDDIAVYRSTTGEWFIMSSSTGAPLRSNWGAPGLDDRPVPSDYDGDGITDLAVFRQSTGEWFIARSSDRGLTQLTWGAPTLGDTPEPADYDGDGRADIAVYRQSTGEWFILRSTDGGLTQESWGWPGHDIPIVFRFQ